MLPENSDKLFLASQNEAFTYNDLSKFVVSFKAYLNEKKYDFSQPIGIIAQSCGEVIFIIAACWRLGIPFICFNPDTKKEKLKSRTNALKPFIIFTDKAADLPQISPEVSNIKALFAKCADEKNPANSKTIAGHLKEEQIFSYLFTSGTSGDAKIVPLKKRQMAAAAQASFQNLQLHPGDYWLLCMPLHHIGGISIILRSLIYGSAIYRLDNFDTATAARILSKNEQIKAISLVPTMLNRLLEDPLFRPHGKFKAILLGGGPVNPKLLDTCIKRDIPVIASYGMTETCAQIAARPVNKSDSKEVSVGRVFKPNHVQIRDSSGKELTTGTSGSVWLKGPQVFDGYYQHKKTKFFDEDGWFNTGDFGHTDETGRLYIEARRTDLIVTGGENVSPFEVENALKSLKEIKDAAVIGLPDEEWGQVVAAAIIADQNKRPSLDEVRNQLKPLLESYKIPKKLIYRDKLPRTSTGKIKRRDLAAFFK